MRRSPRRGRGNWCSAPTGWKSVRRPSAASTTQLASNTGTADRSSNEAFETTAGVNWYLTKWSRAQLNWEHANFATPVQMGNMKKPLTEEDTLYTRFQVIF